MGYTCVRTDPSVLRHKKEAKNNISVQHHLLNKFYAQNKMHLFSNNGFNIPSIYSFITAPANNYLGNVFHSGI